MKQLTSISIVLLVMSGLVVAEPGTRQVGTVAWKQISSTEFSGGTVVYANDHLVFLGNGGSGRVVDFQHSRGTDIGIQLNTVSGFSLPVEESEGQSRTVHAATSNNHDVWVFYRFTRRQPDGALRILHQLFHIDVSQPADPVIVSNDVMDNLFVGRRIGVSGDFLFTSSFGLGLSVLRVLPERRTEPVARLALNSETVAITLRENTLYAADHNRGLVCIDISDPLSPRVIGEANTGRTWDILVDEDLAYAITTTGIALVNVSDPAAPFVIGSSEFEYQGDTDGYGVLIEDQLLVLRDMVGGKPDRLEVYDVSEPRTPQLAQILPLDESKGRPLPIPGSSILMTPIGVAYDMAAPTEDVPDADGIFAAGTVTIPGTAWWNPDTGTIMGPRAGLWWSIETEQDRSLVPRRMSLALLGDTPFEEVTSNTIRSARLSREPLSTSVASDVLKPGTVVLFETPLGRPGKLVVERTYRLNETDNPSFSLLRNSWLSRLSAGDPLPFYHLGIRYVVYEE